MKAVRRMKYGSPNDLAVSEVAPPEVGPDDVLVEVAARSVNPFDWHFARGEPYLIRVGDGLRQPKKESLGIDLAGTIVARGERVSSCQLGDEVFGSGVGTFAELALADPERLAVKPPGLSFAAAATLPCAGVTALQALRDVAKVREGQHLLINGAAGGVGTFALQIAKSWGLSVTGVCSTRNVEFLTSLGADDVIDYATDDFAQRAQKYDVVLDAVGNRSLTDLRRAATRTGTVVLTGGGNGKFLGPVTPILKAMAMTRFVRQQLRPVMAHVTRLDLEVLGALCSSGQLAPVIEATFSFDRTAEAVSLVEGGHVRGKVVIVN